MKKSVKKSPSFRENEEITDEWLSIQDRSFLTDKTKKRKNKALLISKCWAISLSKL